MPETTDIQAPFDPTAYTNITGAQLLQLINGAGPETDKGFVILTTDTGTTPDVPNAASETKWKRYLWLRQQAAAMSLYVWNDNAVSDATFLKWQSITISGIGTDAILTNMIKDQNVTNSKIVSLDAAKLTGTLSPAVSAGVVTTTTELVGDVTGVYNATVIGANAVTTSKINNLAVTNAKLESTSGGVSSTTGIDITTKIKCSTTGLDLIRTNAGATALEHFTPKKITLLSDPASAADVGKFVKVKSPYTDGYELVATPANVILQTLLFSSVSSKNQNTTVMVADTKASLTTSQQLFDGIGTAGVLSITPTATTSKIRVDVQLSCFSQHNSTNWFGLYDVGAAAFVAWATTLDSTSSSGDSVCMRFQSAAVGALTAKEYKIYFGSTNGTAANLQINNAGQTSTVVLFEISG